MPNYPFRHFDEGGNLQAFINTEGKREASLFRRSGKGHMSSQRQKALAAVLFILEYSGNGQARFRDGNLIPNS